MLVFVGQRAFRSILNIKYLFSYYNYTKIIGITSTIDTFVLGIISKLLKIDSKRISNH